MDFVPSSIVMQVGNILSPFLVFKAGKNELSLLPSSPFFFLLFFPMDFQSILAYLKLAFDGTLQRMDWCVKDTFQYFIRKVIVWMCITSSLARGRYIVSYSHSLWIDILGSQQPYKDSEKLKQKKRPVSISFFNRKCPFGYLGAKHI